MNRMCWLASYPKSGNTWLRCMLTVALRPDTPLDLNNLIGRNTIENLGRLIEIAGVDPVLLSLDELTEFRAWLFRHSEKLQSDDQFQKTHLCNVSTAKHERLFDRTCGRAVYIVRNPFDVAVSYAKFVDRTLDETVESMLLETAVIERPGSHRPRTLPQPTSSWASHVRSWIDQPSLPLLLIRYEDMLVDPAKELRKVMNFCHFTPNEMIIAKAVESTHIENLDTIEKQSGFNESSSLATQFFRSGVSGEGLRSLSAKNVERISTHDRDLLDQLNYLPTT